MLPPTQLSCYRLIINLFPKLVNSIELYIVKELCFPLVYQLNRVDIPPYDDMLNSMVRNSELEPMDPASRLICDAIQAIARQHNMTNVHIAKQIGRSPTYVSLRIRGLDAWDTRDINKLAKLFGYPNSFGLLDEVRGFGSSRSGNQSK